MVFCKNPQKKNHHSFQSKSTKTAVFGQNLQFSSKPTKTSFQLKSAKTAVFNQTPWFSLKSIKATVFSQNLQFSSKSSFWSKSTKMWLLVKICKSAVFGQYPQKPRFLFKIRRFSHSCLRLQQGNIYGQTKEHLPRKLTSILLYGLKHALHIELFLSLWVDWKDYPWSAVLILSSNFSVLYWSFV